MKKLVTVMMMIFVLTSLSSPVLKAQWAGGGIKGGLTLSNLYVDEDDLDTENARTGFHAGLYSQMMFSELVGIQPEILFTTKGAEATYGGILNQTVDFRLSYIDIPVLLVVRPVEIFEIHAGPYVGFLIQSNVEFTGTIEGEDELDRDHFNTFDYGIGAGVAFNFMAVKIGLRYNLGLAEIADSNVSNILLGDSKNSYAQLYVAFNLGHRREGPRY